RQGPPAADHQLVSRLMAAATTAADLERRLFEVLGAWAPETPEPDVKLFFRVESFRHAAHAETAGAGDIHLAPVAALLESVAAGAKDTISRLTGVYRFVLPVLLAGDGDPEHRAAVEEGDRLLAKLSSQIRDAKGIETS